MGIFDFFRRRDTALSSQEGSAAALLSTRRYHTRYELADPSLCLLEHGRCGLFWVKDLSFHGCLVIKVADANFDIARAPFMVDLILLGRRFQMEVKEVQKRRNGWGLVFRHTTETSLVELAKAIEPLGFGYKTEKFLPAKQSETEKMQLRQQFSGDGAFDLIVERDGQGRVIFFMATLKRPDLFGSVIWEHGSVITKMNANVHHAISKMSQTAEPDRDLIWSAAVACLGMKFPEGGVAAQLLNTWLSRS